MYARILVPLENSAYDETILAHVRRLARQCGGSAIVLIHVADGWAAAGPHLTYHLAAGEGGVTLFLQRLLASFEQRWSELATWHQLEPEQQRALTQAIERAYKGHLAALGEARDRRLSALLRSLEQARTDRTEA